MTLDIALERAQRVLEMETKRKKVSVAFLGDIHFGAAPCLENEYKDFVKLIKKDSNMYWIGMGDLMEIAGRDSPGSALWTQIRSPNDQYYYTRKILKPIAKRCLGLHYGNHEARMGRNFEFALTFFLADDLGVPYLTSHSTHKIKVGEKEWKILSTHGRSGATTKTGKVNAVLKTRLMHEYDLVGYGHTHDLDSWRSLKYDCGLPKIQQYATTGSFMSYLGSYGEEMNYEPLFPGYIIADIYEDRIDVKERVILK